MNNIDPNMKKDYAVKHGGRVSMFKIYLLFFGISSLLYNVETLQNVGFITLILSILFMFVWYINKKNKNIDCRSQLYVFIILLLMWFVFEMTRHVSLRSIEVLFCCIISILVLQTFKSIKSIPIHTIKKFVILELLFIFIPILSNSAYNPIDNGFHSFFSTTTFLGIFSCIQLELCLLFYTLTKRKSWILLAVLFSLLVYLSKVRTAYIGVLLIVIIYICRDNMLQWKNIVYIIAKWIFISSIIVLIVVYPILQTFPWFDTLETFVYNYTGKILMSGRQDAWLEGFEYITQQPIIGHGLDTLSFDISVHNSYLQHLLECGTLGIVLLFLVLNSILNTMISNHNSISKLLFFYTLINMLMATNEVMLLHGQMILQILIWSIMGLGLNTKLKDH